jgi:hypothetical protein
MMDAAATSLFMAAVEQPRISFVLKRVAKLNVVKQILLNVQWFK